jgi:hypothetical protein
MALCRLYKAENAATPVTLGEDAGISITGPSNPLVTPRHHAIRYVMPGYACYAMGE